MPKTAAVDLGYGHTKAICGLTQWRQPSIVGQARPLHEDSVRVTDVIYADKYFIGDLALRHSEVKYCGTKESKADTWTTNVLLKTALGIVAPMETVNLVTGLPVDFYFSQKEKLQKTLESFSPEPYQLTVGGQIRDVAPSVKKVKIVPQPLGAAMDYLLDDTGTFRDRELAKGRLLVIDLGYYTLDLLALDALEITKESCSPPRLGVDTAYRLVQQAMKEIIGKAPPRYDLDAAYLKNSWEGYSVRPLFRQAFRALAAQIQMEYDSLNRDYDKVIVTGGAAEAIYDYLEIPNKTITQDPQAGNVRGYRKIGVRLWGA